MKLQIIAALFAGTVLSPGTALSQESIPFSDVSWTFRSAGGGGTAIVTRAALDFGATKEDGLHIVLKKPTANKRDTLTLSYKAEKPIDMFEAYPVLDFTFRTTTAGEKMTYLSMTYHNADGTQQKHHPDRARTPDPNTPEVRNYHADMHRSPIWVFIGNTDGVREIRFVFDLSKLPTNEVVFDIGSLRAVAENTWAATPDRDRKWKEWLNWVKTWEPDYSDSSKFLLPPEEGRLKIPLSLTVKGVANAEIICNNDTNDIVKTAAVELQHWIFKISGAKLPILAAPGNLPVKIFLNPVDAPTRFAEELKRLTPDGKDFKGDDGFFVRTEKGNIYIGGLTPKGTQNGVFRFLENNTDIIWMDYNPNYGTVYSHNPDVKAVWADAIEKPRTKYRGTQSGVENYKMRNLGNDRTMRTKAYGAGFFNDGLLESYLAHDEFSVLTGNPEKGYVRKKTSYYGAQACLREEAFVHTRDEMIEKIKKDRAKGKFYTVLNCGIEDNWAVCCCDDCTKPITLPDGTVLTSNKKSEPHKMEDSEKRYRSNQYWAFINRLAVAIREVYPEMSVGALDYFYAEVPPDIPLEKNIFHIYCPLHPSHSDYRNPIFAPSNPIVWRRLNGMAKKDGAKDLYEYYYHFPVAETAQRDFMQYLELGWEGLGWEHAMDRASGTLGLDRAQDYWCMYRLMWNPYKYDVAQLRKYFIRRVYHEGAPVIEKLMFSALEKVYRGITFRRPDRWPYESVIDEKGDEIRALFKEYLPKIKSPTARINYLRMMMDFEDRYQKRKNKEKISDEEKKERNVKAGLLKAFYGNWRDNYESEYGVAETIIEEDGTPKRALRLQFPNSDKYAKSYTFASSSNLHPTKEKIVLKGSVRFKLRTIAEGRTKETLPEIGVSIAKDGKRAKTEAAQYTPTGEGTWEGVIKLPEEGVAASELKGFRVRFRKNQLSEQSHQAEFLCTDFVLQEDEAALKAKLPEIFAKAAAHYKALDAAATPLMDQGKDGIKQVPHGFDRKARKLDMRAITWWTSGHYPGSLWYLYEATGDKFFKERALAWTEILEPNKNDSSHHDTGFMMYCSYGNARRILKTDKYDAILVQTAKSLSKRFHSKLGLLRSWGKIEDTDSFLVIPDNIMNLELLEFASKKTGDKRFATLARSHSDVTMKNHFRPDGGTYHVLNYDQTTGRVLEIRRGQGASCLTAWSRGQSWAIYGYTMMYRETGNKAYLDFAEKVTDFAINHPNMPADGVPYWDFGASGEERDSSAASIMASGLLELQKYVSPEKAKTYRAFAVKQLLSLASAAYFSEGDEIGHWLLKHGVGAKSYWSEVDTPLDYGDYYFLEALMRFKAL